MNHPYTFFCECKIVSTVSNKLTQYFKGHVILMPLNPQTAIIGFQVTDGYFFIKKHILALFKKFAYYFRSTTGTIVLNVFLVSLFNIKHIEKIASGSNNKNLKQHEKNGFVWIIFCYIANFQKLKLWRKICRVKNKKFPFLFCLICTLS